MLRLGSLRSMTSQSRPLHLVALGSSFAAGSGIPPIIEVKALRSGVNYAHIVADRLGARLTDLTSGGATLLNLLCDSQHDTFPPQVSQIPEDADIVTITAGGNDIGFSGGLIHDSIRNLWGGTLLSAMFGLVLGHRMAAPATEDQVTERFEMIIDAIHERAPKAKILLVEYISVIGNDAIPGPWNPLTSEQIRRNLERQALLQRATAKAGENKAGVEVIPIARLSESHGVGSMEPWAEGLSWGMLLRRIVPWHPNARGHEAVADILYARLRVETTQ